MKEILCGIYKVTNQLNNKVYIGQSEDIYKRWEAHKVRAYNEKYQYKFYEAVRKYGLENFVFTIIELCDFERLDEREQYWIKYYDSYNNGYNSTEGGDTLWKEAIQKTQKIVLQYDLDGNFIKQFPSAHEAERQTGIQFTLICKVCRGEREQTGGYIWRYLDNPLPIKKLTKVRMSYPVQQFDLENNLINTFKTAAEAERQTGINSIVIARVCKGKGKTAGGYIWKYKKEES